MTLPISDNGSKFQNLNTEEIHENVLCRPKHEVAAYISLFLQRKISQKINN